MRHDLVIDFIFTVPQTFSFVTTLTLALLKIVRILRLDPNVFQQLSKVFQLRRAHIS